MAIEMQFFLRVFELSAPRGHGVGNKRLHGAIRYMGKEIYIVERRRGQHAYRREKR